MIFFILKFFPTMKQGSIQLSLVDVSLSNFFFSKKVLFWDHFPHTPCSLSAMTNISYKIMFPGIKMHTDYCALDSLQLMLSTWLVDRLGT